MKDPRTEPDYGADTGDSYFATIHEPSLTQGVMTLWRIDNNYLYWINEAEIKEGTYTAFRVSLPRYESAASRQDRRALIEVNSRMEVKSFNSSYGTTYYVLQTGSGVWSTSNMGDCFFLREDGTQPGLAAYKASHQGIDGCQEAWSVGAVCGGSSRGRRTAGDGQIDADAAEHGRTPSSYPGISLPDVERHGGGACGTVSFWK